MKRISSLLAIAIALVVSLCACGENENHTQAEQSSETENAESEGNEATTEEGAFAASTEATVTDVLSVAPELEGTWTTSSQTEYYGTPQPEYYVRFAGSEIVYEHMKDGEFIFDHSSKIVSVEKIADGKYTVKAETSEGARYTYRTSDETNDLMWYYMTWNEDEFSDNLSGSSSIGRIDESIGQEDNSEASTESAVTDVLSVAPELEGTWTTSSQTEYYGTPQPEYYVRFAGSEIIYEHMKDGEFIFDHSSKIVSIEKIADGKYTVKVESSEGSRYTYRTSDYDNNSMWYYMTWNEDEFSDNLSGSSSITKMD